MRAAERRKTTTTYEMSLKRGSLHILETYGVEDGVGETNRSVRPRANSNDPKPLLVDIPKGIFFISLMNKKRNYFVPSTKNYFGSIKVDELKCDSGCNTMLLPMAKFEDLCTAFPQASYRYEVGYGNGISGKSLAVSIYCRATLGTFSIRIAYDLFQKEIKSARLRFSLCSDDIRDILDSEEYCRLFTEDSLKKLRDVNNGSITFHRRHHGLLGQSILSTMASIKHAHCELCVDPSDFILPSSFVELEATIGHIKSQLETSLPAGFDDWEDDDFEFEDEEWDEDL